MNCNVGQVVHENSLSSEPCTGGVRSTPAEIRIKAPFGSALLPHFTHCECHTPNGNQQSRCIQIRCSYNISCQVVKHMPGNHKALISNPSTTLTHKRNKKKIKIKKKETS
jgi:hypothetical protein